MNYYPDEECDLVHGLSKLFSEIDINGDKRMEWSEFTQYVIDAVMQNTIKKNSKGEVPNQKDLLEQAHSKYLQRFSESQFIDSCVHDGAIYKAVYYGTLDRILATEGKSHMLKFLSTDLKRKETIDLYTKDLDVYCKDEPSEDKNGRLENTYFVLAVAYNEKDQMVIMLNTDISSCAHAAI